MNLRVSLQPSGLGRPRLLFPGGTAKDPYDTFVASEFLAGWWLVGLRKGASCLEMVRSEDSVSTEPTQCFWWIDAERIEVIPWPAGYQDRVEKLFIRAEGKSLPFWRHFFVNEEAFAFPRNGTLEVNLGKSSMIVRYQITKNSESLRILMANDPLSEEQKEAVITLCEEYGLLSVA